MQSVCKFKSNGCRCFISLRRQHNFERSLSARSSHSPSPDVTELAKMAQIAVSQAEVRECTHGSFASFLNIRDFINCKLLCCLLIRQGTKGLALSNTILFVFMRLPSVLQAKEWQPKINSIIDWYDFVCKTIIIGNMGPCKYL
jgi:sugar phosphate permease